MAETMTDEEMMALEEEEQRKPALKAQTPDVMTDEEMAAAEKEESGGVMGLLGELGSVAGEFAGNGLSWVGNTWDSIGGAPSRGALDSLLDGENPIEGAKNNFWYAPDAAPTGPQIAQKNMSKVGLPDLAPSSVPLAGDIYSDEDEPVRKLNNPEDDENVRNILKLKPDEDAFPKKGGVLDPSISDVAGFGINVMADWTNFFPGALAAKLGLKGLQKGAKALLKGSVGAADAAVGGGYISRGSEAVSNSIESLKTLFTPSRAETYPEMLDVATKNGIGVDEIPESIEFGPHSIITRQTRVAAEGPLGQRIREKHDLFLNKVNQATEEKIRKIGGGVVLNAPEAGRHLREVWDKRLDDFLDSTKNGYGYVAAKYPGLTLTKEAYEILERGSVPLRRKAISLIETGIRETDKNQGLQILRALNVLEKAGGNFEKTVEVLRSIGRNSFKVVNAGNDTAPDIAAMRQLYRLTSDALVETAGAAGDNGLKALLMQNNKRLHKFFGDKSKVAKELGSNASDEAIFRSLIMAGDTTKLKALKGILNPEDFKALKGAILETLAKRTTEDGILAFKQYQRNLFQKKDTLLAQIFDSDELVELDEVLRLGDAAGPVIMSSSGTGASNALRDLGKTVSDSVTDTAFVGELKQQARGRSPLVREVNPAATGANGNQFAPIPLRSKTEKLKENLKFTKPGKLLKAGQVAGVTIGAPEILEGYLVSDLQDIGPQQAEMAKMRIKNSDLSTTEKARALNLIMKHGKVPMQYLGQ